MPSSQTVQMGTKVTTNLARRHENLLPQNILNFGLDRESWENTMNFSCAHNTDDMTNRQNVQHCCPLHQGQPEFVCVCTMNVKPLLLFAFLLFLILGNCSQTLGFALAGEHLAIHSQTINTDSKNCNQFLLFDFCNEQLLFIHCSQLLTNKIEK